MDERLLAAVRRLWTEEQVETAYTAVLTAYANAAVKEVTIIGTTFDGQNTEGGIVLDREGMVVWMDVLEARMKGMETSSGSDVAVDLITGSPVTNFSNRYVGT